MFPRLVIDLEKLRHNGQMLCQMAAADGLDSLAFVTKVFCAMPPMVAALEELPDLQDRTWTCTGSVQIGDETIVCSGTHGEQHIGDAFANSCNVAFAQIAQELGADTLKKYTEKAGLTASYSVDGLPTAKSSFSFDGISDGQLGWAGVGQGADLVNPAALMVYMGAIANGGSTPEPYLTGGKSRTSYTLTDSSTAASLHSMMRNNVVNYYGEYLFDGYSLCAKTGTAELDDKNPNCWIVGFSEDESTPYAFAVCVQEGTSGLYTAGEVVSAALNAITGN